MNGLERQHDYTTYVQYQLDGSILRVARRPSAWKAPEWANDAQLLLRLPGQVSVHPRTAWVDGGKIRARAPIQLTTLDAVHEANSDPAIIVTRTAAGDQIDGLRIVVDGKAKARTPVALEWANAARVRVELDEVAYTADPIRVRFEEAI